MSVILNKEDTSQPAAPEKKSKWGNLWNRITKSGIIQQVSLLIVLIIVTIVAMIFVPNFATVRNFINVLRTVSIVVIIASGATLLMISKAFDLSVGSTMGLVSILCAVLYAQFGPGLPLPVLVLVCLLAGALVGIANGVLVTQLHINPFLATLATMTTVRGIAYQLNGGLPLTLKEKTLSWLGQGMWGSIPIPVIVALVVLVVIFIIQSRTVFGIHTYSIGGNEEAARLSGIPVNRMKTLLFILTGVCAAVSALIISGRLVSGQPSAGQGMEFDVITAVIIGGTSLDGGVGSVLGTLVGAMFIGVINNIMVLLGLSYYSTLIVKGVIIIVAIVIDQRIRRTRQ